MPRVKIVWSTLDPVGVNVSKLLEQEYGVDVCTGTDCELPGFPVDTPYLDDLGDRLPGYDAYIIISRHSSRTARPTLSIHHTGNPGPEALGGDPYTLEWAWPKLAYTLFHAYRAAAEKRGLLDRYDFTLEATHHGPTRVPRPIVFIEIGSGEREWNDPAAVAAMAEALYNAILSSKGFFDPDAVACTPVAGFGDTHYPRIHTRRVLRGYCYGHILSKHALRETRVEVVEQAVTRSVERPERIVLAKLPSQQRRMVEEVAHRHGLEVERV